MRVVGVLPAAGRAARLQPLTGSKEMLELAGRPVLEYAVVRLRAGGANEIRVVTRPDKDDLRTHALALELEVVEAEPESLAASIAAGVERLAPDDAVLIDLPDSVWQPVDGFAQLVEALEPGTDVVLAVFHSTEPERGDVVEVYTDGAVHRVSVKPAEPTGDLVWGAAAVRVSALGELRRYADPGQLFDELARGGRVRAVRFPGEFIDIGTKEGLARARRELS